MYLSPFGYIWVQKYLTVESHLVEAGRPAKEKPVNLLGDCYFLW